MNIWIGEGRIVRDVELQTSRTGTEFAKITVAVNRRTGKDQEKKTDFVDCTVFGKTAAFVAKYFSKGDGILIRGRLESDTYDAKDGTKRTKWGITVDDVEFPQGKKSDQNGTKELLPQDVFPNVTVEDDPINPPF